MSQHKAPTAVTIAPTREKSALGLWIDKYWKVCAVVVAAAAVAIIYKVNASKAKRTESDSNWTKILALASEDPSSGMLLGPTEDLRRLESEMKGSPAGGWALYVAAASALANQKLAEAETLLGELRSSYPQHVLLTQKFPDASSGPTSVVDHLIHQIELQRAFMQEHPGLFENPPLPENAPRVRLTTDRGAIVVALYSDLAPEHAENFLKLVREGYYNGTKFHNVSAGQYVQGGDPNSIDKDPATWGQGGPGYTLDRKASKLRHFPGVLSAVPVPGDIDKVSGSQFLITTAAVHGIDKTHVPFGSVVEGLEVLKAIEAEPLAENTFNRPQNPVAIQSAEIL
jgi:cyclophilin family peptidyl-prolyl cis-trans isomerase